MLKKVNALILGLATLLALGCGGDEPEPQPDNTVVPPQTQVFKNCRLKKSIGVGSGTTEFFYNNQGQLILAKNGNSPGISYDYNNLGKISRANNLAVNNVPYSFQDYEYNTDSLLVKITYSRQTNVPGQFEAFGSNTFTYDANKRVVSTENYDLSKPGVVQTRSDFTYSAANKVKRSNYKLNIYTNIMELDSEFEITYDNQKTPNHGYELSNTIMKHNQISMTGVNYQNGVVFQQVSSTTSYTFNASGYPIESIRSEVGKSNTVTSYEYECQ